MTAETDSNGNSGTTGPGSVSNSQPTVWISAAYMDPRLRRPLSLYDCFSVMPGTPESRPFEAIIEANKAGEPIPDDDIPGDFYGDYSSTRIEPLHGFFTAKGFLCVTERIAEILRKFGLEKDLRPVGLWMGEAALRWREVTTPVEGGPYYLLMISARKQAFLPDHSNRQRFDTVAGPFNPTGMRWTAAPWAKDGDAALSTAALTGADLWRDPMVRGALFMSDRLLQAFRKKRMGINLNLVACRIVEDAKTEG
jgi:hypothetical protein